MLSISLPTSLLDEADSMVARRRYAGRSELIRASLRAFLAHERPEPERAGPRTATMTVVYPKGHERRIGEVRHLFGEVIRSLTHSDTDAECVEVLVLAGDGDRIREFAQRLRNYRETRIMSLTYTDQPASAGEG